MLRTRAAQVGLWKAVLPALDGNRPPCLVTPGRGRAPDRSLAPGPPDIQAHAGVPG